MPKLYFLLFVDWEKSIDTEKNFVSLFMIINALEKCCDKTTLYSCQFQNKSDLKLWNLVWTLRVIQHDPLGLITIAYS